MDSKKIFKLLIKDGWVHHHTKGSHWQFKHPKKPGKVTLPHPKRDLPTGTIRNIFKQAWLKQPK